MATNKPSTEVVTVRLERRLKRRLDALARASKRSKSFLAAEAIGAYVDSQEWQLAAIHEGIAAADRGELVTHDAVSDWVDSWDTDGERPPPEPE